MDAFTGKITLWQQGVADGDSQMFPKLEEAASESARISSAICESAIDSTPLLDHVPENILGRYCNKDYIQERTQNIHGVSSRRHTFGASPTSHAGQSSGAKVSLTVPT